jgi:hypothetical protein
MTEQQHPSDIDDTTRTTVPPTTPLEPYPTIEPDGVAFEGPVRRSEGRTVAVRLGILAGSAVLLVIGVVAAMGASPAPTTGAGPLATTTPNANSSPGSSTPPSDRGPRGAFELPFGRSFGFGFGGIGLGGITVTAVDGSNVSLRTDDGWTRTIAVASDTKITKGGATIAVGDLAVGDHVRIAEDRASVGAYQVTAIAVALPSLAGQVSAVSGDTLTITQPGGTKATIHVSGTTTYEVNGAAGKLSDIKVGSFIIAEGSQRADGSLDAAGVRSGFGLRGVPGGPGFGGSHRGGDAPKASPAPSAKAS